MFCFMGEDMKETLWLINSVLLGVGLAMDAFSVSLANGLNEPEMKRGRMALIAGIFGGFQTLMPLAGWIFVHTILNVFQGFSRFIPWIALILLVFLGVRMILEGIRNKSGESRPAIGLGALMLQGTATSIDALSVGFAVAYHPLFRAVISSLIIGAVTFAICSGGLVLGRRLGTKLSGKASVLGGVILILIGIEIILTH